MNSTYMTTGWKGYRKVVVFSMAILCLVVFEFDSNSLAQTYTNSAHGNASTGIERSSLGVTAGGAVGFAIGNCIHCHEQHASVGGTEPVPDNTGPDNYLGFEDEEELCYGCHGNGNYEPAARQVRDNIETDTAKIYGHGPTLNSTAAPRYKHRANETSVDGISALAHVECTDCHNPHQARTENNGTIGPRVQGSNVIGPNSPLLGVSGVEFSNYPNTWTNPTTWIAANPANYTYLNDIPAGEGYSIREYQICFKCHSSFSGNTDDWDGNPGGSGEWTDLALEFNPANNSYHPVIQPLAGDQLDPNQLIGVDRTWNPGETMYCSDCHASNDSAISDRYGPHGSTTKWLLTGTNQNWPYLTVANNGLSAPTNWANLSSTANATTFCRNCHPDPTDQVAAGGRSNNVHASVGQHTSAALECAWCHIRVPHGGSVSRLISTFTAGLPNRYRPSGAAGGSNPYVLQFTQSASYVGYSSNNCQATSGGPHGGAIGGESW